MKTPTIQSMRGEPERQATPDEIAISVRNLTKKYRIFGHPGDRIKQALTLGKMRFHQEFTALQDVSFEIKKGETVGIIGRNGSGKSTLLQLICGILKPTSGEVQVNGRISALLELGAGFNPEFTGRENVYFQGALMGFTKAQMDERFDNIAAFADIGEFIDQPVRTYSSGMYVRLAFAVAVNIEPDILIVDEALSVGDYAFRVKCLRHVKSMIKGGCSTIMVSHDFDTIKNLCNRAMWLKGGTLKAYEASGKVCDEYVKEALVNDKCESGGQIIKTTDRNASCASIIRVEVEPQTGKVCMYGEEICVRIRYRANIPLERLVVSFYIKDLHHLEVIGSNSEYEGILIGPLGENTLGRVEFSFRNPLRAGQYEVTALLADSVTGSKFYDWIDHACSFKSIDRPGEPRWAITCPLIQATSCIESAGDTRMLVGGKCSRAEFANTK